MRSRPSLLDRLVVGLGRQPAPPPAPEPVDVDELADDVDALETELTVARRRIRELEAANLALHERLEGLTYDSIAADQAVR